MLIASYINAIIRAEGIMCQAAQIHQLVWDIEGEVSVIGIDRLLLFLLSEPQLASRNTSPALLISHSDCASSLLPTLASHCMAELLPVSLTFDFCCLAASRSPLKIGWTAVIYRKRGQESP